MYNASLSLTRAGAQSPITKHSVIPVASHRQCLRPRVPFEGDWLVLLAGAEAVSWITTRVVCPKLLDNAYAGTEMNNHVYRV